MKNNNTINIAYDPEADVLTWELHHKAPIDYASEVGNVIVHFTKQHIPVLIEIVEASTILSRAEVVVKQARKLYPRPTDKYLFWDN